MYLARLLVFLAVIYYVDCRNNVKSLTDSLGQEVIEIGTPIKELQELPPGLEEEPSAEVEEKETPSTASRRENKRVLTTTATTTVKPKEEKEESGSQEDEEARIEKELAEIYKDTDYKSENTETKKVLKTAVDTNVTEDKPIGRSRVNFKFQPDVNNRDDIERFRTSVDEISCDKRVTQKLQADVSKSSIRYVMNFIETGSVVLFLYICY